ncbi:MAG: hypothetical protein OEM50_02340 [Gammaproteobacteria bacterium]|nr:hypothetical protein [Gammaproteobacteria bacterium]MDH3362601.1 hypothetical protein [Gammaproteobacteria bacterium]MDH3480526.1 hypothetical protein [Gammaproteobacteria bacterium]
MNFRAIVVFFWACLIGTAAVAGEDHRTRIEIAVDDDGSSDQTFVFDSREAGFDLHSLAVGESQALTDRSGNAVVIRRTVDGFEFDVNGRTINVDDMPMVDGTHGEHEIEMHVDHNDSNVKESRDIKKVKIIKTDNADGVTIISGREIDATTRERIQDALKSSGLAGDVQFIDGSEFDADSDAEVHGRHEVRIIKKEIDVTN